MMRPFLFLLLVIIAIFLGVIAVVMSCSNKPALPVEPSAESISPLVSNQFGRIVSVQGRIDKRFLSKDDEFLDIESYCLTIYSVNAKKLPNPIVIQCRPRYEIEKETLPKLEKMVQNPQSSLCMLAGYEVVEMSGDPSGIEFYIPGTGSNYSNSVFWRIQQEFIIIGIQD